MFNKRLEKLNKLVDYYEDFYNRKKKIYYINMKVLMRRI